MHVCLHVKDIELAEERAGANTAAAPRDRNMAAAGGREPKNCFLFYLGIS
jgi:hypothetical protein